MKNTFFKSVLLISILLLALANKTKAQISITGSSCVVSAVSFVYTFSGSWQPSDYLTWTINGGVVTGTSNTTKSGTIASIGIQINITWNGTSGAYVQVMNSRLGTTIKYVTVIGIAITPVSQSVNYGASASIYPLNSPPGGSCTISYQWQYRYGSPAGQYTDIPGATLNYYTAPSITQPTYFIRRTTINGTNYFSTTALVDLLPFTAGTITLSQPCSYNSTPVISQYTAGGGCAPASYVYEWEQSIENGPWSMVGTGLNYPAGAPVLIGNTRIRRKVTCPSGSLYTNILNITPLYTTVDYENRNYVREIVINKKGIISWMQADNLSIGDKIQSTTYLDGLGRPIQVVDKQINPVPGTSNWLDFVKHFEYDAAGRVIKDFIPYPSSEYVGKFKPNAATVQPSVYSFFDNETSASPTNSLTEYDDSPLNRVKKSMSPGAKWGGSNIGAIIAYDFNKTEEKVHIWDIDYTPDPLPVTSPTSTYSTGKLLKIIYTDEKLNKVITYTDLNGNVILKKVQEEPDGANLTIEHAGWVCTYYVYDDFNQLRYIITPKAVKYLDSNGWSMTQALSDEFCFKYLYDEKGRAILKKQPGVGEENYIYDKQDRLVLTQHANQLTVNNPTLSNNQWSFTIYDELNRILATGLLENNSSRSTLQGYVNSLSNSSETISAFVGNGQYQTITANLPVAGSTSSTNSFLLGNSNITFNSITHFDNYSYTGIKTFNTIYSFAYTTSDPNIEPTIKSDRTTNMVTGEKTRVVDNDNNPLNDQFLFATGYFDEKAQAIQNLSDNIKSGTDYQAYQYDFSGKLMSTYTNHIVSGASAIPIISKNEYDKMGRLTKLSKNFNNSFYKVLTEQVYEELGRVKSKRLAPGYTSTGKNEMESQSFNYNIQGWLTGINKAYALNTNNYTQWDNYFGLYLGYDNSDNSFTAAQYNGNLTGSIWRSQGDNAPRKYDYEYDKLDRFKNALFNQKNKPNASWSGSEVDFSTYVEYEDGNGNIKSMKHMGIIPGVNNGVVIDDLRYSYLPTGIANLNGNKLKQVDDLGALTALNNGLLGDFRDANTTQDYYYDVNGNLVKDLNKNIKNASANGVTYNYMNKTSKIVIEGKSIVEFGYDASGEKLSKKVTNTITGISKTAYYIGGFVYEDNTLQYILHEEGRLKIITPISTTEKELNAGSFGITNWLGGKQAVFEYFIKDQLGNTRMVLTEEVQKEFYRATVERTTGVAAVEEPLFGKVNSDGTIPNDNELKLTRYLNNPPTSPWPGKSDDYTRLTAAETGKDMGPNLILKVMAGDIINTNVNYYYFANNPAGPTYNPVNSMVGSLLGAILGNKSNVLSKNQQSDIGNNLNLNSSLQTFLGEHSGAGSSPKAYLNIVFFDEQFKFVDADPVTPDVGSGFIRVSLANNASAAMGLQKKAPKNGWVFIYLSNESNETVYFDDLYVSEDHSRISEETHYYPFGLKIGGISSRAFNKLDNKFGYQGDFSEIEDETGWDEFFLRLYDPQIGRWTAVDPKDQFFSPFVAMCNNPANTIDQDGGWSFGLTGATVGLIAGGTVAYFIIKNNPKMNGALKGLISVGLPLLGAGIGYSGFESPSPAQGNYTGSMNKSYSFLGNFLAFYKELFTASGSEFMGRWNIAHNDGLATPEIWGSFFEWIDDSKATWLLIDIQKWVSEGYSQINQGSKVISRSIGPIINMGSGVNYRNFHYELSTSVPGSDDSKTSISFSEYGNDAGVQSIGSSIILNINDNNFTGSWKNIIGATKVSLIVDQKIGNVPITVNGGRPGPGGIAINIKTYKKKINKIKRLKLFGIKTPITKK